MGALGSSAPLAERLRELMAQWQSDIAEDEATDTSSITTEQAARREGGMQMQRLLTDALAAILAADTLLATLDGREAWNEAIEAAAKQCENDAALYRPRFPLQEAALVNTAKAIRALARPQPAGGPE